MSTSTKGWCVRPFLYTRCGIREIERLPPRRQAVKHGGVCVCVWNQEHAGGLKRLSS